MALNTTLRPLALRLSPGQELKIELLAILKKHDIESACVLTCVGSLRKATIRLANHTAGRDPTDDTITLQQNFEIVSLVGTLEGRTQSCHLHISMADEKGRVIGGHLVGDCEVFTTVEVVLGALEGITFARVFDESTGFKELSVTMEKS